jgi:hypothetical protein
MLSMCSQTQLGGLRWRCVWLRVVYAMPACMCSYSPTLRQRSPSTCRQASGTATHSRHSSASHWLTAVTALLEQQCLCAAVMASRSAGMSPLFIRSCCPLRTCIAAVVQLYSSPCMVANTQMLGPAGGTTHSTDCACTVALLLHLSCTPRLRPRVSFPGPAYVPASLLARTVWWCWTGMCTTATAARPSSRTTPACCTCHCTGAARVTHGAQTAT